MLVFTVMGVLPDGNVEKSTLRVFDDVVDAHDYGYWLEDKRGYSAYFFDSHDLSEDII